MRRANRTGTIYKLQGKRHKPWVARSFRGYDPVTEKRIYLTIGYFRTKTEAERALAMDTINPVSPRAHITLAELYDEWSAIKYARSESVLINSYKAAWKHLAPLYTYKFIDLRTAHFQKIIDDKSKDLGRSSLSNIKLLIGNLYKYAMQNDICSKNYATFLSLPKKPAAQKEVIPDTEIQIYKNHDNDPAAQIFLMLIYSGMRIQELLNLTVFDVNLAERTITGGIKTESGKNRTIPIHKNVLAYWCDWVSRAEDKIFIMNGVPITQPFFRIKMLYPFQHAFGLPRRTPHSARHTCATLLAREGVSPLLIKQILGHSNYALTANVYTHPDSVSLLDAIDKI